MKGGDGVRLVGKVKGEALPICTSIRRGRYPSMMLSLASLDQRTIPRTILPLSPIMKFLVAAAALISAVTALPANGLVERQVSTTDELSFSLTLPQFTVRRNNRDPPTLDWTTDGCTSSPDNPFGYPFLVSSDIMSRAVDCGLLIR
jgi:hypothetical protein